jgi:hypothetical protein
MTSPLYCPNSLISVLISSSHLVFQVVSYLMCSYKSGLHIATNSFYCIPLCTHRRDNYLTWDRDLSEPCSLRHAPVLTALLCMQSYFSILQIRVTLTDMVQNEIWLKTCDHIWRRKARQKDTSSLSCICITNCEQVHTQQGLSLVWWCARIPCPCEALEHRYQRLSEMLLLAVCRLTRNETVTKTHAGAK